MVNGSGIRGGVSFRSSVQHRKLVMQADEVAKQGWWIWGDVVVQSWKAGTGFVSGNPRNVCSTIWTKKYMLVLPLAWRNDGGTQYRCSGQLC